MVEESYWDKPVPKEIAIGLLLTIAVLGFLAIVIVKGILAN